MPDRQFFAIGHADHLFDQINAGDQLGHGVFHLQTRVHFKEIEIPVAIDNEFHRAGTGIANGLRQCDSLIAHLFAGLFIQKRAGRFFDHFLIAPLDRAFTLAQINRVSVSIGQHLNLNVSRLRDEFLDKNAIIAKAAGGLVPGTLEPLAGLLVIPGNPHPLAATTGRGLEHHRIANLAADLDGLLGIRDHTHVAGDRGHTGLFGDFLAGDLVTHALDCANRGANECHAFPRQGFGEQFVFAKETVTGMHGLGTGLADGIHHLVNHDVGFIGGRRADQNGLVCHFHMQRVLVRLGIDRDRFDPHLLRRFDHPTSDFPTVCDQYLFEHLTGLPKFNSCQTGTCCS